MLVKYPVFQTWIQGTIYILGTLHLPGWFILWLATTFLNKVHRDVQRCSRLQHPFRVYNTENLFPSTLEDLDQGCVLWPPLWPGWWCNVMQLERSGFHIYSIFIEKYSSIKLYSSKEWVQYYTIFKRKNTVHSKANRV